MPSKEKESIQLLQGTLDLIVLRTLAKAGQKALTRETARWRKLAGLVALLPVEEPQP
jgi:hypothetical protein